MEEIILGKEARDKLLKGIDKLANAVKVTLGPNGKTVIVHNEKGEPYNTKDGVSVSRKIKLKDPIENIGAQMVKQVAEKTVDEAGDGTTTSTVLVQSFIKEGINFLDAGGSYNELKKIFNESIPNIVNELKQSSIMINTNNVLDVATVSANNDLHIGEHIQMAFNFSNTVKVEEGKESVDKLEFVNGSKYGVTYFSKQFITNDAKNTAELKEPKVLLLDDKLTDLNRYGNILKYCSKENIPLVIITEFITEDVLRLLETNHINNFVKILPIKTPGFAQYRKEYIKDISVITGATILNNLSKNITIQDLGELSSIITSPNETLMLPKSLENINERVSNLKSLITTNIDDYSKKVIEKRIEILNGKVAIIKVGGLSEIEMKERYDRYDDAVRAVSSALEEGIVKGGGLALYNLTNDKYHDIINNTLKAPTLTIINNGASKSIINNLSTNIVDPVKVTKCALENSASIALTILGTESIIIPEYLW